MTTLKIMDILFVSKICNFWQDWWFYGEIMAPWRPGKGSINYIVPGEISSDLYRTKKVKSKLNNRNTLTTLGDFNWYTAPINETNHDNSYLDLTKYLWDFQILSVTL